MSLQTQLYEYLKTGQRHRFSLKSSAARPEKRITALTTEEAQALDLPPYALLRRPEVMPAGTWALHCSRDAFRKFRWGSRLQNLHLSTLVPKALATLTNLMLPLDQAIFSFAYDPYEKDVLNSCTAYGLDGYLFQTDQAIRIFHRGDNEHQLIFPTRSEYNMHHILVDLDGVVINLKGNSFEFATLEELIQFLY